MEDERLSGFADVPSLARLLSLVRVPVRGIGTGSSGLNVGEVEMTKVLSVSVAGGGVSGSPM